MQLDAKIKQSESVVNQKQNEIYSKLFKDLPALQGASTEYWGPQAFTSGPVYLGSSVIFLFFEHIFIFLGCLQS